MSRGAPFLNAKAVKQLVREHGRIPTAVFLAHVSRMVHRKVVAACKVHNGVKRQLDTTVARYVGIIAGE